MTSLTPFERALAAHLVADWLLQTDWMARHKMNVRHPAGWVHAGIHGILLGLALDWRAGIALGALHWLIDTGRPLGWWLRVFKKCADSPHVVWIRIWTDQALHIVLIAAWVAWF